MINYGPDAGKICTIIDVVDNNKVFVDGPVEVTGVNRHVISLRRLSLTDLKVTLPVQARAKTLKKALAKEEIVSKWESSSWSQTMQKKAIRANLSDMDRFKLMIARKQKSKIIRKKVAELRKQK